MATKCTFTEFLWTRLISLFSCLLVIFVDPCLDFIITQPQGFSEVKGKQQLEGSGSGWALGVLETEPRHRLTNS